MFHLSASIRHYFLLTCVFALFGFLVYGQSLRGAWTTWDDAGLITENPIVQESGVHTIVAAFTTFDPELYIPLTLLSYKVNHAICGNASMCYHATDLALHIASAVVLTAILAMFVERRWLAILGGILFLVHPLNVESVAWASARKDTLSTLFYFLSILFYLFGKRSAKHYRQFLILAFVSMFLALLSKVMAATVPFAFVLFDIAERPSDWRRAILEKLPFIALAGVFIIIAFFGKAEIVVHSTSIQKVLMATLSTLFYLWKFFWPFGLSVMYPFDGEIAFRAAPFFWTAPLAFVLGIASMWALFRAPRIGVGACFFFLALLPTFFNFAKAGEVFVASDRYVYVSMLGVCLLVVSVLDVWIGRYGIGVRSTKPIQLTLIVACVILTGLAIVARAQSLHWQNSRSLFERVLSLYPDTPPALNNLGMQYFYDGDVERGLPLVTHAISRRRDPRFLVNLAAMHMALGRLDAAESVLREAILTPVDGFTDGLYQMGVLAQRRGKLAEAASWYQQVLAVHPESQNALNNLGAVYIQQENWQEAIATLSKSVALYPSFAHAHYNLAGAYEQAGDLVSAEKSYQQALAEQPRDPDTLVGIARVRYAQSDIDGAAQYLMRALSIDSSNESAAALVRQLKKDGVAE